jgi:hypothetical protein
MMYRLSNKSCTRNKAKQYIQKEPMSYALIMKCACCGGDMMPDKDIGSSIIYKCQECGLSESRLKESK